MRTRAVAWALAGSVVLCMLVVRTHRQQAEVLYTAAHAEVAPFQRVWNPDTNSDYSPSEGEAKAEDEGGVGLHDTLCGQSLEQDDCPDVPAFNGEDYFDEKPIGCCYNKQQQAVWDKWNLLKKRVAKLEGQVHYLRNVKRNVEIKQSKKASLTSLRAHGVSRAHPQAVHTQMPAMGGSSSTRERGAVGGKPYFHGIRLLERRRAEREASTTRRKGVATATRGVLRRLKEQPVHMQELKLTAKKAPPTSYYKAGPDQASRDGYLASKYQAFLSMHHPMQGGRAADGEALEKYAKLVTTSTTETKDNVPTSLGFRF